MCWELTRAEGLREAGWTLGAVATCARRMFKKHLLGARLDQRLRTWVSKVLPALEELLVEGREAHDLSINTSELNTSERGGQVS